MNCSFINKLERELKIIQKILHNVQIMFTDIEQYIHVWSKMFVCKCQKIELVTYFSGYYIIYCDKIWYWSIQTEQRCDKLTLNFIILENSKHFCKFFGLIICSSIKLFWDAILTSTIKIFITNWTDS